MKNIHVLPTDKPSRLQKFINYPNDKVEFEFCPKDEFFNKGQHIYITEDVKIITRGWYIDDNEIYCNSIDEIHSLNTNVFKKIILTTDQDLIKDGVQAIDDEFLEWFVKNPSCERVETEFSFISTQINKLPSKFYKIIIPKGEHKKYPIGGYAPGSYLCNCVNCKTKFIGDKRAVQCEPCAIKSSEELKQEPKQETIEEVGRKVERSNLWNEIYFIIKQIPRENVDYDAIDAQSASRLIEKLFYKWQEQNSDKKYSEEEVEELLYKTVGTLARLQGITINGNFLDEAYNKFKKK